MDNLETALNALRRIRDANIAVAAPIAKEALDQIEGPEPSKEDRRKAVENAARRGFHGDKPPIGGGEEDHYGLKGAQRKDQPK